MSHNIVVVINVYYCEFVHNTLFTLPIGAGGARRIEMSDFCSHFPLRYSPSHVAAILYFSPIGLRMPTELATGKKSV